MFKTFPVFSADVNSWFAKARPLVWIPTIDRSTCLGYNFYSLGAVRLHTDLKSYDSVELGCSKASFNVAELIAKEMLAVWLT